MNFSCPEGGDDLFPNHQGGPHTKIVTPLPINNVPLKALRLHQNACFCF